MLKTILDSQILGVIIGAFLGFLGTYITVKLQVKNAGKIRSAELMEEKKIEILQAAYKRMKDLETKFWQESPVSVKSAHHEIADQQNWFFYNQLFLPVDFGNTWMQIRTKIYQFNILNAAQPINVERLDKLDKEIVTLMKEALGVIYKAIGREPLKGETT